MFLVNLLLWPIKRIFGFFVTLALLVSFTSVGDFVDGAGLYAHLKQRGKELVHRAEQYYEHRSWPTDGVAGRADVDTIVASASERHRLPPDLVHAVIRAESNYNPHAVSHKGAMGMMQLMPATAIELGVYNPFSAEQNIDGGCRYLRRMLDHFNGDMPKAIAAYNAGPEAVEKHNGIPPYRETQEYVRRVLNGVSKPHGNTVDTVGVQPAIQSAQSGDGETG